jgi:CysZ protein
MKLITDSLAGAVYPFRAVALFYQVPRLLQYVLIPLLVNILLGIGLYAGLLLPSWSRIDRWILSLTTLWDQWLQTLPSWLSFLAAGTIVLGWLLKGILILGLFVLVGFLLVQFGTLLAAPWYGQLSEQLEQLQREHLEIVEVGWVVDIWRTIVFEIKKLMLVVAGSILGLGFNLLPGLGTIAASLLGFSLATLLVCLDFLDPPLERRRLAFRQKLGFILQRLPASGSFGLICLLLVTVPGVNLVTVPICIAAGTLFYCDRPLPLQKRSNLNPLEYNSH